MNGKVLQGADSGRIFKCCKRALNRNKTAADKSFWNYATPAGV